MATPFFFFLVNDALGFLSIGLYTLGLVGLFTFSVLFHSIYWARRGVANGYI